MFRFDFLSSMVLHFETLKIIQIGFCSQKAKIYFLLYTPLKPYKIFKLKKIFISDEFIQALLLLI